MSEQQKLLDAGIFTLTVEVEGGNDEGGGYPVTTGLTAEQQQVVRDLSYEYIDQFVDQLGYGSFAGEFYVSGTFEIDVVANQMVPGTWHGSEGSMQYESF